MSKECSLKFNEATYIYECAKCGTPIIAKELLDAMHKGETPPIWITPKDVPKGKAIEWYCSNCGNKILWERKSNV